MYPLQGRGIETISPQPMLQEKKNLNIFVYLQSILKNNNNGNSIHVDLKGLKILCSTQRKEKGNLFRSPLLYGSN